MITVQEFALKQLHGMIQKDPWVQAIMLAAGTSLNEVAEKLVEAWNIDNFDALSLEQCQMYERMLNLTVSSDELEDRRAGIEAAWRTNEKPTEEMLRTICDGWKRGEVTAAYDFSTSTITLTFSGQIGIPDDIDGLKRAMVRAVPAHIQVVYAYRYLKINEVHNVMTLAELAQTPLSSFAGGGS